MVIDGFDYFVTDEFTIPYPPGNPTHQILVYTTPFWTWIKYQILNMWR